MTGMTWLTGTALLVGGLAAGALLAQQPPAGPRPFFVGNALGLPIVPAAEELLDRYLASRGLPDWIACQF